MGKRVQPETVGRAWAKKAGMGSPSYTLDSGFRWSSSGDSRACAPPGRKVMLWGRLAIPREASSQGGEVGSPLLPSGLRGSPKSRRERCYLAPAWRIVGHRGWITPPWGDTPHPGIGEGRGIPTWGGGGTKGGAACSLTKEDTFQGGVVGGRWSQK